MGPGFRGVVAADIEALSEDTSAVVLPMRVIFLVLKSLRGIAGFLNGGFWRPSLPPMSSFWFEGGMESSSAILSERSDIVASCAKDNVMGLPWCVSVTCSSSAVAVSCGASVAMMVVLERVRGGRGYGVRAVLEVSRRVLVGDQDMKLRSWLLTISRGARSVVTFARLPCRRHRICHL